MRRAILTLNVGSSSIKYALFACDGDLRDRMLAGQVDGFGAAATAEAGGSAEFATHEQALHQVFDRLDSAGASVCAVGHRIVHGGTAFDAPALIDDATLATMTQLESLAPLHQPQGLAGVRAARAAWPGVPQVACFDTAFFRRMPELHQRFALPQHLHDAGVRRYGFHGLSYESIHAQLQQAEPASASGRIVVAHLGNGASMCALEEGRAVATTMSFSPLDGLTMGTRCGRLDAAVVLNLWQHMGMDAAAISRLLHRESGLLGLSGLSSDMRELQAAAATSPRAALAIDHFVESALRELAGMAAALRGLDRLVFTGGIGENAAALRARIVQGAAWMGIELDARANRRAPGVISAAGSPVTVQVLHADEEAVIARHVARIAKRVG